MMDNLLVLDDMLTRDECKQLIKEGSKDMDSSLINSAQGYAWSHCYDYLQHPILGPLTAGAVEEYTKRFPSINMTVERWIVEPWRFKHFPPGKHFSIWHQEHSYLTPYRVGCMLMYLSDHDCGTEFYNGDVVKSRAGRILIFPTFWTHTHRGQPCPEGKDRYIMSTYLELVNPEVGK